MKNPTVQKSENGRRRKWDLRRWARHILFFSFLFFLRHRIDVLWSKMEKKKSGEFVLAVLCEPWAFGAVVAAVLGRGQAHVDDRPGRRGRRGHARGPVLRGPGNGTSGLADVMVVSVVSGRRAAVGVVAGAVGAERLGRRRLHSMMIITVMAVVIVVMSGVVMRNGYLHWTPDTRPVKEA